MKVIIVLALALAAVALAVQGETIKIKGRGHMDTGFFPKVVTVEADTEEKVQHMVFRLCEELYKFPPVSYEAKSLNTAIDINLEEKVGGAYTGEKGGLKNGDQLVIYCYRT